MAGRDGRVSRRVCPRPARRLIPSAFASTSKASEVMIAKRDLLGPSSGLIATTVENSGNQNVSIVPIVDDVIFDGERPNTLSELRPEATHPRSCSARADSRYDIYDFVTRAARPRDLIRSASCRPEVLSWARPSPRAS